MNLAPAIDVAADEFASENPCRDPAASPAAASYTGAAACLIRKLYLFEESIGAEIGRGSKEARDLHLILPCVLQHMDAPLRKKHGAAGLHTLHDAIDHHPARSVKNIDHFFTVGVGMRGPNCLAGVHLDHAHGAMLRIRIFIRYDPTKTTSRNIVGLNATLIYDWKPH
jgi:hypothetical protein